MSPGSTCKASEPSASREVGKRRSNTSRDEIRTTDGEDFLAILDGALIFVFVLLVAGKVLWNLAHL